MALAASAVPVKEGFTLYVLFCQLKPWQKMKLYLNFISLSIGICQNGEKWQAPSIDINIKEHNHDPKHVSFMY
jgi:hypothetical protein